MVDLFGVHRTDDTNIIRDLADVRKEARDFLTGLAVFFELDEWAARFQLSVLQLRKLLPFGERFRERLAMNAFQLGLVIEALEV